MKELQLEELENINGGSLNGALGNAGGIALSGLEIGLGAATFGSGCLTADAPLVYSGVALAANGIDHMSNFV